MAFVESKNEFKEYYQEKDIVEDYDKYREKNLRKRVVRELERYAAIKDIKDNSDVLEVGFGTGFVTEGLIQKGCHVRGVDTSEEMLSFASSKLSGAKDQVNLSIGSIFELDEVEGTFDTSLSVRVYIHLKEEDSSRALAQMAGKVKNGGYVIFDVPSKSSIKILIDWYKTKFGKKSQVVNFKYGKTEILNLFTNLDNKPEIKLYAVDHLLPLSPFYALGYVLNNSWYENFLLKLEKKLLNVHLGHTKWFVVYRKNAEG